MLQNYVKPYRRTWQRIIKFFIISRKKSSDWLTIVCLLQRPAFSRLLQRKVRREPWWVTLLKELPCITLWVTHCNTLHSHCPGLSRTPSNRFWRSMTPGKSSTSCVSTWWVKGVDLWTEWTCKPNETSHSDIFCVCVCACSRRSPLWSCFMAPGPTVWG